jgi:hypothetical protein
MARQPRNGKQRVILVTPHVFTIGGEAKQAKGPCAAACGFAKDHPSSGNPNGFATN